MDVLPQYLVTGLVVGATYGLIALGFVLIYKASAVLNLAQGELIMIGAYICFFFSAQAGIPFFAAVALTLPVSLLIGVIMERLFLRHMIGQPLVAVIMMTIGLMVFLRGVVSAVWGDKSRAYVAALPEEALTFGSIRLSYEYLISAAVSVSFLIILLLFFRFTKTGLTMRAVADEEQAAQSVGISIKGVLSKSWSIAALTAAVGGIILALLSGGVNTSHFPEYGLRVLPVVLLGGLESIPGAIIGGIIIGLSENLAALYVEPILGAGMKELMPYIIVLLILVIRPYGLFGLRRIERI